MKTNRIAEDISKKYKKLSEASKDQNYALLTEADKKYVVETIKESYYKNVNQIVAITETILVDEKVFLEKGDRIKILAEANFDWEDIVVLIRANEFPKEFKGLVNYVNTNRNKFSREDINDFIDWYNEFDSTEDADRIVAQAVKQFPPTDMFENLPTNDWKYFKAYA